MSGAARTLVVGLGNPDRGDDAVAGAVVARLHALDLDGVDLVERDEPIRLLDIWSDYDRVVVVDAVRGSGPPGTVSTYDPAAAPLPSGAGASSHVLGLAEAVELARSLGRLPRHLVVVGVEAAGAGVGQPLSPAVEAAVEDAIASVVRWLEQPVNADV